MNQTTFFGRRLSIGDYKRPYSRGAYNLQSISATRKESGLVHETMAMPRFLPKQCKVTPNESVASREVSYSPVESCPLPASRLSIRSLATVIGASLSEPHHVRSTVKSVFLLACFLACLKPYRIWLKTCLNANQHYIKYMEC